MKAKVGNEGICGSVTLEARNGSHRHGGEFNTRRQIKGIKTDSEAQRRTKTLGSNFRTQAKPRHGGESKET